MLSSSTDTTASNPYIGRFAPSPTGPLHFGSLLAALASYLDAKSQDGQWLIRMEDLDPPREMPEAKERILEALDVYQLYSDEPIVYQSQRSDHYQEALDRLIQQDQTFPCSCSRKQLSNRQGIHFGRCPSMTSEPFAWRFNNSQQTMTSAYFEDLLQGRFEQDIEHNIGDFVVKRKDQLWAYQLALVVDDYLQGITHVIRGIDLIDSTLRQNMLQQALGYPQPSYGHIPVACGENGQKLSKQNFAPALDLGNPQQTLWRALSWLGQKPPNKLRQASVKEMLVWATAHWDLTPMVGIKTQAAPLDE
jgi:glutamyl-Q tRNA(Asp) synthetase